MPKKLPRFEDIDPDEMLGIDDEKDIELLIMLLNKLDKDIFFGHVSQYHTDTIRDIVSKLGYDTADY